MCQNLLPLQQAFFEGQQVLRAQGVHCFGLALRHAPGPFDVAFDFTHEDAWLGVGRCAIFGSERGGGVRRHKGRGGSASPGLCAGAAKAQF